MGLFSSAVPFKAFFNGFSDCHCHILYGVDDGVGDVRTGLSILSEYSKMGVRRVFLTPHVMEDVPNTPQGLQSRFEELKSAIEQAGVEAPELHLASENMLDRLFEDRLESGDVLPYDEGHILVETSYYNPPFNMDELLFKVRVKGYTPVLAHPERYIYMEEKDYRQLKRYDIMYQLNLSSLLGFYGDAAKKKAEWLLKEGLYDLTGTDLHRMSTLQGYKDAQISSKTAKSLELLLNKSNSAL